MSLVKLSLEKRHMECMKMIKILKSRDDGIKLNTANFKISSSDSRDNNIKRLKK